MNTTSPAHLNSITELRETANTVFIKVDNGVYLVQKDRNDNFSGRLYVSTSELIDELNSNTKVVIFEKSQIGTMTLLHKN